MKLFLSVLFLLLGTLFVAEAQFKITNLQVEYQSEPLGLDEAHPRFSWQMESVKATRGEKQTAYRIIVENSQKKIVWDSQKISSDISLAIPYAGLGLQAMEKYAWKVQVWNQNKLSNIATSSFETGLMLSLIHI
jgi:alpha-L-rhamnosidase